MQGQAGQPDGCRFQHSLHARDLQLLAGAEGAGEEVRAAGAAKQKEAQEQAVAQMAAQQKAFGGITEDDDDEDAEGEAEMTEASEQGGGHAEELEGRGC